MTIFLEIQSRFSYINLRIIKILNESLKCQKPYEVKMTNVSVTQFKKERFICLNLQFKYAYFDYCKIPCTLQGYNKISTVNKCSHMAIYAL